MWSAALGPGSTVKDMAWVYQEQVASQVAVQAQAVLLSERDVNKMADMEETFAPACMDTLFHKMAFVGQGAAGQAPAHSGTQVDSVHAATTHEWATQ